MRFAVKSACTGLSSYCAVLCFATVTAYGAPMLYNFSGTTIPGGGSPSHVQSFHLAVPDFLPTVLDGGPLPVVSNDPIVLTCVPCEAPPLPALYFLRGSSGDIIQFEDANGTGYVYFFPVNSLSSLGTHATQPGINVNRGTLVVTATPEASTIWSLLLGIGAISLRLWLRPLKIRNNPT